MICELYKKIEKGSIFDKCGLRGFLYRNRGNEKLCVLAFTLCSTMAIDKVFSCLEEYKKNGIISVGL